MSFTEPELPTHLGMFFDYPLNITTAASFVILVAVIGTFLIATKTDYEIHRIPNRLLKWSFAIALPMLIVIHCSNGRPFIWVSNLHDSAVGALSIFSITFAFWLMGYIGGGDVKLMTFIGLLVGAERGFAVLSVALLCAAVFIVCRRFYFLLVQSGNSAKSVEPIAMAGFLSLALAVVLVEGLLQ